MARLAARTIAIASGKGGVGKSTVSLNLAVALGASGHSVGLLDADFYGPDIPRMIGLARTQMAHHLDLWTAETKQLEPLDAYGVKLMSAGFLVGENQSISFESGLVGALLIRLTSGVACGDPDYLIVDLPPGTADIQQQLMRQVQPDGVILVVTPQDVAHLDAKKVIDLCRLTNVPVLGAIENMSGLDCPGCGERVDVFPRVSDDRSIWVQGVERLAAIPMDPEVALSGDKGRPILVSHPSSVQAEIFRSLAAHVAEMGHSSQGGTRRPPDTPPES